MINFFSKFSLTFSKLEGFFVSVSLLFMIALAFVQVLLRNLSSYGVEAIQQVGQTGPITQWIATHVHAIEWGDPVIRAMVVWVGFIGASIATSEKGHIRFDIISKFLPTLPKKIAECIVHFASALVCILLAHAAYKFLLMEKEFANMLTDQIPNWVAVIILPTSFALMALRMFFQGLGGIFEFFRPSPKGVQ